MFCIAFTYLYSLECTKHLKHGFYSYANQLHTLFFKCNFIQALYSGDLVQGGMVTEGSAGSTAISLATVAPAYGCKCHVVIPNDAAIEKVLMIPSYF